MAKGKPLGAPKRTTRIPARGTTLEAAEMLLLEAQDQAAAYDTLRAEHSQLRKWHFLERKIRRDKMVLALVRYMTAIRGAQRIASKRVGNAADTSPDW